jgi:hypothetical protein
MEEEVGKDERRVNEDFFKFFAAFIPVLYTKVYAYPVNASDLSKKI